MSGAQNPLLQGPQLPSQQPVQQQPPGEPVTAGQHLVAGAMRGKNQQAMVSRRDAAGPEMEILSRVMNDPKPNPKEVTEYLAAAVKSGQVPAQEAIQILQSMPRDPDALRTWARAMFSAVMHAGVHGHAAFPRSIFPGPQATPGAPQAGNAEAAS